MLQSRLFYIDNLRIFLISLVVLHHLAITYGAPGGWYYEESEATMPALIPLSMFVTGNQSFFMGMFFFISAFFIAPSLQRKGIPQFVSARLLRLALPTALFYFLVSPYTVFIKVRYIENMDITFMEVWQNKWGFTFGPMWFVLALLIFTTCYLLIRPLKFRINLAFPGTLKILLVALAIGIGQFLIRINTPIGVSHQATNFQFPFFLQYIVLFPLGIIAWQNKWMDHVTGKMGLRWFLLAQVLILLGFPVLFIAGGADKGNTELFMGGLHWQNLAYALWEQLTGFSLMIGLFGIFKTRFNTQGKLASLLSENAYGVYIFHTPALVIIGTWFLNFSIPQFSKFLVLAPLSLLFSFLLSALIRLLPGVKRII